MTKRELYSALTEIATNYFATEEGATYSEENDIALTDITDFFDHEVALMDKHNEKAKEYKKNKPVVEKVDELLEPTAKVLATVTEPTTAAVLAAKMGISRPMVISRLEKLVKAGRATKQDVVVERDNGTLSVLKGYLPLK